MASIFKTHFHDLSIKPRIMTPRVPVFETGISARPAERIRILMVITRLTIGGDTNVVLDIASSLNCDPNYEVHLAVGPVPDTEVDLTHLAYERGIPTFIIPSMINQIDPVENLKAVMELRKVIVDGNYSIVHTHSSVGGVVGRMAAFSARVPVIVHHVHGWGLQPDMSVPMRTAYLSMERLCAAFTNRLIGVSKATIEKGLSYHISSQDKFALIYNGIQLEKYWQDVEREEVLAELGLDPECKIVGMIGRLDKQKNPLDFIRSAALVINAYPKVQFVIAGEGSLRTECEQLIHELGLEGRFFLLGFRNDIERILPALTLTALSSLWEGLPVVFQEAMSAGKPIVANNVDGASDVIIDGKTGFLVTPHNLQEMADRILCLLQDDELCYKMGVTAQYNSQSFSTEKMVENIAGLYRELITQKAVKVETSFENPIFLPGRETAENGIGMENQVYLGQTFSRISNAAAAFSLPRFLISLNEAVKRGTDVVASLFGLLLLLPLFLAIGILIKRDSPGPIFYRGKRSGKGGGTFEILKFRTMYESPSSYEGSKVTAVDDDRITPIGRWLRDTKINELPQLWNVLMGEMSLVGPRPEDPDIAMTWSEDARKEILSARPGITSPASVIYRHEEKLLNSKDVMSTYMKSIQPSKIRLDQLYVRNRSFLLDLDVILWTFLVLIPGLGEYQPPENYLFWGPVYRLFRRYISWFLVDAVISIFAFGMVGLFWESLERLIPLGGAEILVTLGFALLFNITGALIGINRINWSKAAFTDVFDMVPALVIATTAVLLIDRLLGFFPTSLILLSSALAFTGFIVIRYRTTLVSSLISRILRFRAGGLSAREKVLIIGSGHAGRFAARMLSAKEGAGASHVVGFIDDDYYKTGERIRGTRVLGDRNDIPALVARYDVGLIIFAIHNIDPKDREAILEICHKTQASVFLLPDFLGVLQNIASLPNPKRGTIEGNPYPIDLSYRDQSPVFAEEVMERDSFIQPAEQLFSTSQNTQSHLMAMLVEVNNLDQLLTSSDRDLVEPFLLKVANHCRRVLRNIDLIGLYDGGKIAILLPDNKAIPAKVITNRLSHTIEEASFENGDRKVRVKLNFGVALRDEVTPTLVSLLDRAGADLIAARQARGVLTVEAQDNTFQKNNLFGDFVSP